MNLPLSTVILRTDGGSRCRCLETSTGAIDAATNGRTFGAPPVTMIAQVRRGTCHLTSQKMKTTNKSQPSGAVFLFSR
jgi:hypothetical protein